MRDIAVFVHARRDFHVDADIDVGELRVHQRIDADAADARLEAAGGGRLAVADLQRRLHVIHGAQLRRLQHLAYWRRSTPPAAARPGSVVEKSAEERWPRLDSGMAVPVAVLVLVPVAECVPVVVVPVVSVVPVVLVVGFVTTCSPVRGVKFTGTFRPVEAMAAVSCREYVELASITRMSTTTSLLGLSRSWMNLLGQGHRSASPRAMMAFCAL